MSRSAPNSVRRGASLIEAVAVVLVLAIAVPPTISMTLESANRRADAIAITRATTLASAVMDQILCDAVTDDLGANVPAYLETPSTGLRARLAPVASIYTDQGFTFEVSMSGLMDRSLTASGDPARDLYRTVDVTVRYVDSTGAARAIPVTTVISLP